jgi:hypothetical protein
MPDGKPRLDLYLLCVSFLNLLLCCPDAHTVWCWSPFFRATCFFSPRHPGFSLNSNKFNVSPRGLFFPAVVWLLSLFSSFIKWEALFFLTFHSVDLKLHKILYKKYFEVIILLSGYSLSALWSGSLKLKSTSFYRQTDLRWPSVCETQRSVSLPSVLAVSSLPWLISRPFAPTCRGNRTESSALWDIIQKSPSAFFSHFRVSLSS